MVIEDIHISMIRRYVTVCCVKFTDCQVLIDIGNCKVHDAQ